MIRARILEPALQAVIGVIGVDVRKSTGVIAIICSILSVEYQFRFLVMRCTILLKFIFTKEVSAW